jgi:KipI family sensor histidine kinase inhibitor
MTDTAPAMLTPPRIVPAGEAALLVELGDEIGEAATDRVLRLATALDVRAMPGVIDRVPGYTTLLVVFDPALVDPDRLCETLVRLDRDAVATPLAPGRLVTIPVSYGGEFGPDLKAVAKHAGLSEAEVIERHAGAGYRVGCVGFVPGFAYLVGLPSELETPRRSSPRSRVPAGSVAIGGAQTGVYPFETPGGWHLIGRTPLRPFDPNRDEPALLQAGDRVRFEPIAPAAFAVIADQVERGEHRPADRRGPGEPA